MRISKLLLLWLCLAISGLPSLAQNKAKKPAVRTTQKPAAQKPVAKTKRPVARPGVKPAAKPATAKPATANTLPAIIDTTADTTKNIVLPPLNKVVAVGNSMPRTFKGTRANAITRKEQLYHFFDTLTTQKRPVRIVHIGDSHVRGHAFTVATRKKLEAAWGSQAVYPQQITYKTTALARETGRPGLVYHALGKNGATCVHFSNAEAINQIVGLKPDLIILSFGTNECHVSNYDSGQHLSDIRTLVTMLHEACPSSTIMLTTPGGAYFSYKNSTIKKVRRKNGKLVTKNIYHTTYKPNKNTVVGVGVINKYAKENNLPVWDLYTIGGGQLNSCNNWTANKLMKTDRIHYTFQGYAIQGDMLAEALLKAYNDYIKQKNNAGKK